MRMRFLTVVCYVIKRYYFSREILSFACEDALVYVLNNLLPDFR